MNRVALFLHFLFVCLGIYFLLAVQINGFANDPGIGWHLKTGEFISTTRQIPQNDPFLATPLSKESFSAQMPLTQTILAKREWIADQWLGDYLLFKLYQFGGFPSLYLMGAILFPLLFFGLLFQGVRLQPVSLLAASIASALAFKASQVHFILRPVLFGIGLFLLTTIWLYHLIKQDSRQPLHLCHYLTGSALFFLWANTHPTFPLGLMLVCIFIVHRIAHRDMNQKKMYRLLLGDFLLFSACLGATLMNPYGISLHTSILTLGKSAYFMQLHEEWLPMNFAEPEGQFFIAMITFGSIGAAFLSRRNGLKSLFFLFASSTLFALLAIRSVRILPYAAILLSFPTAIGLSSLFEFGASRTNAPLKDFFQICTTRNPRKLFVENIALGACLLFLVLFYWNSSTLPFTNTTMAYGPDTGRYPIQEVLTLKKEAEASGNVFILGAHPNYGGIITLYGYPEVQALIDDRNTLIGEEFHKKTLQALWGSSPEGFFLRQGATHLLRVKNDSSESTQSPFRIISLRD